jgi:hypothetical protein
VPVSVRESVSCMCERVYVCESVCVCESDSPRECMCILLCIREFV